MNITRRDAVKLGAGVFGTASALGLAAAQKVNPQVKGSYNFEAGFTDASFGTKICEQWIAATSLDAVSYTPLMRKCTLGWESAASEATSAHVEANWLPLPTMRSTSWST